MAMFMDTKVADAVIRYKGEQLEAIKQVSGCTVLVELVKTRSKSRHRLMMSAARGVTAEDHHHCEQTMRLLLIEEQHSLVERVAGATAQAGDGQAESGEATKGARGDGEAAAATNAIDGRGR